MKKIICFVFSILAVCLLLPACKKSEKAPRDPTVRLIGCSDSVPGISATIDSGWYPSPHQDQTAPKTVTVEFCGETVTGEYFCSNILRPNYYQTDEYHVKDKNYIFSLDRAGKIASFFWFDAAPASGLTLSQEECLEIAETFLSEKIGLDPALFATETTVLSEIYTFSFTKYAGKLETAEQVRVGIRSDGALYSFSSFMSGKIPEQIPDYDFDGLTQRIYKQLDEMCAPIAGQYEKIEYTEPHYCLTMLNETDFALTCTVNVVCTQSNEEHREEVEILEFLIS